MYITGLSVVAQQVHLQLQYPIQSSGSGPGVLFRVESSLQLCNWEAAGSGLRNATPSPVHTQAPSGNHCWGFRFLAVAQSVAAALRRVEGI